MKQITIFAATLISTAAVAQPSGAAKMGIVRGNDVHNTLAANLSTGLGYGLEYEHSVSYRLSAVGGISSDRLLGYDNANRMWGVNVGADWFLFGRRNEGLKVGSRFLAESGAVYYSNGQPTTGGGANPGTPTGQYAIPYFSNGSQYVSSYALTGEAGYDFISRQGITAGLTGGLRLNLFGNLQPNVTSSYRTIAPFGMVDVGYSW